MPDSKYSNQRFHDHPQDYLSFAWLDFFRRLREGKIRHDIFVVTSPFQCRLDAIAWKLYRNTELWWIIGHANGIIDPTDPEQMPIGMELKIPKLDEIDRYIMQLRKDQRAALPTQFAI